MYSDYLVFNLTTPEHTFRIPETAYSSSQFGKNISLRVCQFFTKHDPGIERNDIVLYAKNLHVRNLYHTSDFDTFLSGENHYNLCPQLNIHELPKEITLVVKNMSGNPQSWENTTVVLEIIYSDQKLEYQSAVKQFMN